MPNAVASQVFPTHNQNVVERLDVRTSRQLDLTGVLVGSQRY
ncbi:hypothetical protein LCAZH_2354 [Lacticaseibacillus paracasei]|nr:hypothetical protein LCAZH_2354 [Lacticaseibacillus paracasei]AGP69292.1 Hypothetical protein LOCK919_2614 [Lacticaseibacillus paracasei]EPC25822.1 hypothetical protein Lpp46_1918 [Lacticaseibacillus paracasei subsp. paracasei Lpp46]